MLKVKKAFLGLAAEAVKKSPMSLIGIGADKLLKSSSEARSIAKNLGIGGNELAKYYEPKKDQTQQNTIAPKTATMNTGGMIEVGKGKDYIKDLI